MRKERKEELFCQWIKSIQDQESISNFNLEALVKLVY